MDDSATTKLQQAIPGHVEWQTSVSKNGDNVSGWDKAYQKATDAMRGSVVYSTDATSPTSSDLASSTSNNCGSASKKKADTELSSRGISASLPGSYAVSPGGGPLLPAHDFNNFHDPVNDNGPSMTEEGLHGSNAEIHMRDLIEAELIDPEADERRLDEERDRLRLEAMEEFQSSVPKAEIVDTAVDERRRKRVTTVLVTITVASVIAALVAGVVLGIRRNNTPSESSRSYQIQEAIQSQFGHDIPILEPDNLYSTAFQWMVQNDTYPTFPLKTAEQQALFRQRFALCLLAYSTQYHHWLANHGWISSTSECTWHGLNCNSDGGLSSIQLGGMKLNGTIPTELFLVTSLEHLQLYQNWLTGTIPSEIGNLSQLKTLALHESSLVGSIPSELGNVRLLETLYLFGNHLNGTVPSEMKNLYNIKGLYLNDNKLSGTLSQEVIPYMVVLETLALDNNKLAGSIPAVFGYTLLELRSFTIQNNSLTGTIPGSFADLIHLQSFKFSGNKINGSIPVAMCNLPELQAMEAGCGYPG